MTQIYVNSRVGFNLAKFEQGLAEDQFEFKKVNSRLTNWDCMKDTSRTAKISITQICVS